VLYPFYTADFPLALDTVTAIYADDTAVLAAHKDHIEASQRLQESLFYIQICKKMENQSQWGKICTGDFHHPQKDVPTSNLKRPEDPSSREREVFGIWLYISIVDQTGESTYSPSENNLEFN